MTKDNKKRLKETIAEYNRLEVANQLDYNKFYLYSLIAHSTAIEGSTVTEEEVQMLFDYGRTSGKRNLIEQMMNLDLKNAYEFGYKLIKKHKPISVNTLIELSAKVMEHTGGEYNTPAGKFSAAKGELRKLNVTAGVGGRSYMSYLKVPQSLKSFCSELNLRRKQLSPKDICAIYELSFWAHYELVTIHPWADGNGRTSRLLMNLLQMEFDLVPAKVFKSEKADYINSLIHTRDTADAEVFINFMTQLHTEHIAEEITNYITNNTVVTLDKWAIIKNMKEKWFVEAGIAERLTEILSYVADRQFFTTGEVVAKFSLSPSTAKRYLAQLVAMGYIHSIGANRNRRYIFPPDATVMD